MTPYDGIRPIAELDMVPWSTMRHAYGSAADVPGMIRALAGATDITEIADAEHRLWCSLLHQGQVYSATAPALPFLLGLNRDRPDIRSELADWFGDLRWVLEDDSPDGPAAGCRAILEAGTEAVTPLLDDSSEWVRSTGAGFLGGYRSRTAEIASVLRERLANETSDGVRADLLISVATLTVAGGSGADVEDIANEAHSWWKSDMVPQMCAAAHARCVLDPSDQEARAFLAGCLPLGRPLGWWWGSGFPAYIVQTLSTTEGGLASPDVLEEALVSLEECNPVEGAEILEHILDDVFPRSYRDVPRSAAELSARQRHVIEFLASGRVQFAMRRGGATIIHVTQATLSTYRLPCERTELHRWLTGSDLIDCVRPHIRELIERDHH
jgi:hypothetical protein